jgi:hypothetical protein
MKKLTKNKKTIARFMSEYYCDRDTAKKYIDNHNETVKTIKERLKAKQPDTVQEDA